MRTDSSSCLNRSVGYFSGRSLRRFVVVVLMACQTLSYMDRQILSLLVAPMKHDLHLSDTGVALLQGLAFALLYTIVGFPMGWLVDRFSRRSIVSVGVLVWSTATITCSLTRNFWSLFGARTAVGIGEAALAPAALSLLSDNFPNNGLNTAMSLYAMGIFLGAGLSYIVGGAVMHALATVPALHVPIVGTIASWRITFLIAGLPGLVVAGLASLIPEPTRTAVLRDRFGAPRRLGFANALQQVGDHWQSVWGLCSGIMFQSMCSAALGAWLPTFFERVHHWPRAQTGYTLGLMTISFGCLGMLLGGYVCDKWQRRGVNDAPLRLAIISAAGIGACVVCATNTDSAPLSAAFLAPTYLLMGLPTGGVYAALQSVVPNQIRGVVAALLMLMINLGGLTLGTLLPALLTDYLFRSESSVGHSIAIAVAIESLLSILLLLKTLPSFSRDLGETRKLAVANS